MKIRLSSVFELSKYLATKSGKELEEALQYISELSQQLIDGLTNKLSDEDNTNCETRDIQFISGQVTNLSPGKSRIKEIRVRKVVDDTYYVIDKLGWNYAPNGQVNLYISLDGSPTGVKTANVIIYY
jgi:hypothetical protein